MSVQIFKGTSPAIEMKTWKTAGLQVYRLGMLSIIVLLIHTHRVRLEIEADLPVTVSEVTPYFPRAFRLLGDSERMGLNVNDSHGNRIGYIVRTRPLCDSIIGYNGPTDTMIIFDRDFKVLGVKIRRSPDTYTHVADVNNDPTFLKTWDGKSWDDIATMDLKKEGVEGVSGATLTSMSIAQSVVHRLQHTRLEISNPPPMRIVARDLGLAVFVLGASIVAFSTLRGRKHLRRVLQAAAIVYVGLINGELIAQSLLSGWAVSGVAWRIAPGMALLAAAGLLVPWATRRPLYCQYICPHGAAQELLDRISPKRFRIHLPHQLTAALRWLPALLLALVLIVTMLVLPLDLASLEPFDAYIVRSAGWATLTIAAVGLLASIFVPMAYCKFGCPTGALLEFLRSHGRRDSFARRDVAAALLVALTGVLYLYHDTIMGLITGLN